MRCFETSDGSRVRLIGNLALSALAAALSFSSAALAQPANDNCSTATIIPSMPFVGMPVDTTGATDSLPDPSCNSTTGVGTGTSDIWYKWTNTGPGGLLSFRRTSSNSNDTVTSVWTNSTNDCLGTWTELACSDGDSSNATVSVAAGMTVFIRISMWSTTTPASGSWSLITSFTTAPTNDTCETATPLTLDVPISENSLAASNDGPTNTSTTDGCSAAFFSTANRTVWYTFTPAITGDYTFSLCATRPVWDNKLSVYAGTVCTGTVAALACNDDSCGVAASVTLNLTSGNIYTIRVSGGGTSTLGAPYIIGVNGPAGGAAPMNDDCATPITLISGVPVNGSLAAATGSSITLATCGTPNTTTGRDVWYTFTPIVTGTHTVSLCGNFDTVLSTHTSCVAAASVCNDDTLPAGCQTGGSQLTFTGIAGTPVLVRVAGVGPGTLNPEFADFSVTLTQPAFGACCLGGTCSLTLPTSCTGESVYQGNSTTCTPSPCAAVPGDLCTDPIIATLGVNMGNTLNATTTAGATIPIACALQSRQGKHDIYFLFTAGPAGGSHTFSLCDSTTVDTILSLHNNVCPSLFSTLIASSPNCADNGCTGSNTLASIIPNVPLSPNQVVLIRVANWSDTLTGVGGPFALSITSEPLGACCTGSICLQRGQSGCTGVFAGAGVACNVPSDRVTPCCKADFNKQGGLSIQDVFDFQAAWFASDARADINGTDGVTIQDVFEFLAAWFGGC